MGEPREDFTCQSQGRLRAERVVVTGSAGFLGQHLMRRLKQEGVACVGFDVASSPLEDICDEAAVAHALRAHQATTCVHLAAVADLTQSAADPERNWRVNVEGTRAVLAACSSVGTRLFNGSSCCVYGSSDQPCREDSPRRPNMEYSVAKNEADSLVVAARAQQDQGSGAGLAATTQLGPVESDRVERRLFHSSLRLPTFYGPGQRPNLATARFLGRALSGARPGVHSPCAKDTRHYTYVLDVVEAIIRLLTVDPSSVPPALNIASPDCVTTVELAEACARAVSATAGVECGGVDVVDVPGDGGRAALRQVVDVSEMHRVLMWLPPTALHEGLCETVRWIATECSTHGDPSAS